jgi:lipoprotein
MWRELLSGIMGVLLILACTLVVGSGILLLLIYVKTPLQLLFVGLGLVVFSLGVIGILLRD